MSDTQNRLKQQKQNELDQQELSLNYKEFMMTLNKFMSSLEARHDQHMQEVASLILQATEAMSTVKERMDTNLTRNEKLTESMSKQSEQIETTMRELTVKIESAIKRSEDLNKITNTYAEAFKSEIDPIRKMNRESILWTGLWMGAVICIILRYQQVWAWIKPLLGLTN